MGKSDHEALYKQPVSQPVSRHAGARVSDQVPHLGVRLGGVAWYFSTSWLLALSACFSSVAANAWAVARLRGPSTPSATARHLCTHTHGELPRLQ